MKKIISLLIVFVLTLSLFSCSEKWADDRLVMKIGKYKIVYDQYRYMYLNTRDDSCGGDLSCYSGNSEAQDALRVDVVEKLRQVCAIQHLSAKYGVSLSEDEKTAIEDYIKSYRSGFGSEEEYIANLDKGYLSEYCFKWMLEYQKLWQKLFDYLTDETSGVILADDSTVVADTKINFFRTQHIYIGDNAGDDYEANRELIYELCERAKSGEDFVGLIKEYGEDNDMASDPENGRYFTVGQYVESYENVVTALNEGEISDVMHNDYGYYVIKRLPVEEEYVLDNIDEFRYVYMARVANEIIAEQGAEMEIKYSDLYETLTVYNIK